MSVTPTLARHSRPLPSWLALRARLLGRLHANATCVHRWNTHYDHSWDAATLLISGALYVPLLPEYKTIPLIDPATSRR